jgi:putative ABC transport system permease protein
VAVGRSRQVELAEDVADSLAVMVTAVAVGYSGLAVANSMAMAAYGRRTDFAVMK